MVGSETHGGYRIYTRAFDRVVTARELDSVLGPLSAESKASLEKAWDIFQTGLMDWRMRVHLDALTASERLRRVSTDDERADTVITLLVDQSGSMRGQSILLAAAATDIAQNFLAHLDYRVEILGFTTVSWKGGLPRKFWKWWFRPKAPGRLCELLHIIYRSADSDQISGLGWTIKPMLRPDLLKENIDGEALLWASERLAARPEKRKIIVMISDGAPVDDSTLLANDPDILTAHLREVIADIETKQDIELFALGIGFDVARYYAACTTIKTAEDLGTSLIELLERALTGRRPRLEPS
jgi:cobaltochelatase CobT